MIPQEAVVAEHIVSVVSRHALDRARSDSELCGLWLDEVNTELAVCLSQADLAAVTLTMKQLRDIGDSLETLFDQWARVSVGESLVLQFPLCTR